jgi:hypothetical protein
MSKETPTIVWIIHWMYYDRSDVGIINRAFVSEDEARWQAKLLIDLADGRKFTLHSLPVHP